MNIELTETQVKIVYKKGEIFDIPKTYTHVYAENKQTKKMEREWQPFTQELEIIINGKWFPYFDDLKRFLGKIFMHTDQIHRLVFNKTNRDDIEIDIHNFYAKTTPDALCPECGNKVYKDAMVRTLDRGLVCQNCF